MTKQTLALISDIHGNLIALQHVMDELEHRGVDTIICLGDVAATGPQPSQCLDLLAVHQIPVILGNADEWLLNPSLTAEAGTFHRQVEETDAWCAQQLSPANWHYLRSFPRTLLVDTPLPLLCFHGTPRSNTEIVEATTLLEVLVEIFNDHAAKLLAGGHTHQQLLRRVQDRILINPGSVGLPYEIGRDGVPRNAPWAEYALVHWQGEKVQIEFCRTPLEIDHIRRTIRESGMPYADVWADGW